MWCITFFHRQYVRWPGRDHRMQIQHENCWGDKLIPESGHFSWYLAQPWGCARSQNERNWAWFSCLKVLVLMRDVLLLCVQNWGVLPTRKQAKVEKNNDMFMKVNAWKLSCVSYNNQQDHNVFSNKPPIPRGTVRGHVRFTFFSKKGSGGSSQL